MLLIHKNNLSEMVAIDFSKIKGSTKNLCSPFICPLHASCVDEVYKAAWIGSQLDNLYLALLPIIIVHHYLLKDFPLLLKQVKSAFSLSPWEAVQLSFCQSTHKMLHPFNSSEEELNGFSHIWSILSLFLC